MVNRLLPKNGGLVVGSFPDSGTARFGPARENRMNDLPRAAVEVQNAANALGLAVIVRIMTEATRTAEDAAKACGCPVGAIVKSLIFMGKDTGRPYLLLVSGENRVDEAKAAEALGERIVRADARFVRTVSGYAIGGIPPIGHIRHLVPHIDADLLQYETVWAAAGTPNAVFAVSPAELRDKTGGIVIAVK
jgi:prolyl-tRNA editing enzyme YbaK/EbsC (Cys-tRNA(Pro) deacylase)